MRLIFLYTLLVSFISIGLNAQDVDYSIISVPEESGMQFVKITEDNDAVCMPQVVRSAKNISWFTNRIIDVSPNGENLAFLSYKNNRTNIFIKSLQDKGASIQRTNRSNVIDFSYSPDGKYICFSEKSGNVIQLFRTEAASGYICRQITNNNKDLSPIYSADMSQIFFSREEQNGYGLWSYDLDGNFLLSYTNGINPTRASEHSTILFVRVNNEGRGEIWKSDYKNGIEECIVTDAQSSFSSPCMSPDGNWILFVGSKKIVTESFEYWNTDLFVVKKDGTCFTQLTYHAADDLSPIWSADGTNIYFISQRGSAAATANVWKIPFNIK